MGRSRLRMGMGPGRGVGPGFTRGLLIGFSAAIVYSISSITFPLGAGTLAPHRTLLDNAAPAFSAMLGIVWA